MSLMRLLGLAAAALFAIMFTLPIAGHAQQQQAPLFPAPSGDGASPDQTAAGPSLWRSVGGFVVRAEATFSRELNRQMGREVGVAGYGGQQAANIARPDSRPGLAAIRCPTLVLVGDADQLTPPDRAAEIASGTLSRVCSRRWAVTMISLLLSVAAAAGLVAGAACAAAGSIINAVLDKARIL